jgi:hypothetical protein
MTSPVRRQRTVRETLASHRSRQANAPFQIAFPVLGNFVEHGMGGLIAGILLAATYRKGRPARAESPRGGEPAALYMASTGCQWRKVLENFPLYTTVRGRFYAWRDQGRGPCCLRSVRNTMPQSDFSGPCISHYGSSPSRCGPCALWPMQRSPGKVLSRHPATIGLCDEPSNGLQSAST